MVHWFEIYTWFIAVENAQPKFVFGSISLVYVLVFFLLIYIFAWLVHMIVF